MCLFRFLFLLFNLDFPISYGIIHLVRSQNFQKQTNIYHWLICTHTFAYQGLKNNSLTENFVNVLNE